MKKALTRYFLRKKILNPWVEKASTWKKPDWIIYLEEIFDKYKRTKWTKKYFPDLESYSYTDLDSYKVIRDYPEPPPDYPKYLEWKSSGTVKPKTIRLSREDALGILKAVGRFAFDINAYFNVDRGLGIVSTEPFATATMIRVILEFFTKKSYTVSIFKIDEYEKEIVNHGKYGAMITLVGFLMPLFKKIIAKYDIFTDSPVIITSGETLTPSVFNAIYEYLAIWQKKPRTHNVYACAESGFIAASITEYNKLVYYPEVVGLRILTAENELIDIFNAKKGVTGEAVITILRKILIPNYALGDIIRVEGQDPNGLPIIEVLGRKSRNITLDVPGLGLIEGLSGAVLRVAGAPLHTLAFDQVMAKLNVNYLIIVDDYKLHAKFIIYTNKKINEEEFWAKMLEDYRLAIWHENLKLGAVEFEFITDQELIERYDELVKKLVEERHSPKLPRIIVRRFDD